MVKDYPSSRDCEHGQLRRACPICEAEKRLAELVDRIERLLLAIDDDNVDEYRMARAAVDALVGEG